VELNRYQYGVSNPITFSDPSGYQAALSFATLSLASILIIGYFALNYLANNPQTLEYIEFAIKATAKEAN